MKSQDVRSIDTVSLRLFSRSRCCHGESFARLLTIVASTQTLEFVTRLAVGAIGGLAVGIEREWSGRAEGSHPRFAGVRTFLLIGLLGSLSSSFLGSGLIAAGVTILMGAILLVVIAYAASAYRDERDSTTEFAALMVIATGVLAGRGDLALASALNVFLALVLIEKSRIHSFVYSIQSEDLTAGLRFAVLALVILPLLPKGPYGPAPGIYPQELWALVLLFSGLSFAGFIARKAIGFSKGYILAGFLGGLVSSTLVTLNFARESRNQAPAGRSLASGVVASCAILPVRTGILLSILNMQLGLRALPHLLVMFFTSLLVVLIFSKKIEVEDAKWTSPKNPLRLFSTIQMVIAFQVALLGFYWLRQFLGNTGVLISSAVAGSTDVDVLTFMLGRQTNLDVSLGVLATLIGVTANTILKMMIAFFVGKGFFRTATPIGLLAGVIALWCSWLIIEQ